MKDHTMRIAFFVMAAVFVAALCLVHQRTAQAQSAGCDGHDIAVVHTLDKASVNPGDAFVETTTITNTGASQLTLATIGRMEDVNETYDLTTHMDTIVLNPGKSRSIYSLYHMPCACSPGTYVINRRVLRGANVYTPACFIDDREIAVTSESVCP